MKPIILCILDGVGIRKEKHGNAVKLAKMPTFNKLLKKYPHSLLDASEQNVGLPKNQMGNSEVGHTNIGAGRIVYQPLEIINNSIKDKTFFKNKKLINYMNSSKKLHILGLLSDGGIHSHINHLFSLIDMAKQQGIEELYIHIFTDGRDTLPDVCLKYINQLEEKIKQIGIGQIASISGRYYAMDRDNNYDRIKPVYDVLTTKTKETKDYKKYIENSYVNSIYDEFIKPIKVTNKGTIKNGDNLIVFNFRPDRLRELFSSLTNPKFDKFETKVKTNLKTMFTVSDEVIYDNIFEHSNLDNCLGPYLDNLGLKQLRIAETEKYAHVTYFFDGGKEIKLKGSKRILIPSPKVATYDLKPEMSALKITNELINQIDKNIYDVIILNYANGDMVGHTGNLEATIKSLETLDDCLEKIYNKVKEKKGLLIVTADHGNSDYMLDKNDNKITSHSMSKVPFIITNKKYKLKNGKLADIAPTILKLLNKEIPEEMTGKVLIKKSSLFSKIFITLSLLTMFSSICIYSYRLVHFYKLEQFRISQNYLLSNKIMFDNDNNENLKEKDKEYIFYGNNPNNYVYYSNQMWRILKINEDKTITLINDDNVSSLVYSYNTEGFENSYLYKWLNEKYYNALNKPDLYLENGKYCVAPGKTKEENCKEKINSKVGLISYNEYIEVGANNSYLNINKYFWTLTPSTGDKTWYVFNKGGMNDNSNYYGYGVRPVIILKNSVNYVSGIGTKQDPYIFEESEQLGIGSYIKYSDCNFRIISKNENSINLALTHTLDITHKFSNTTNIYKQGYNSLYNYLNNDFYNLLDKSLLVDGNWCTGEYTDYNYENVCQRTINSKVGLLNVSDLFTTDSSNYFTSTGSNDMIISYSAEDNLMKSEITENKNIKPVISITNNIKILSGTGKLEDPYIVGSAQ